MTLNDVFHGSAALQGVAYSTLGICSDTPGYHPYFCTGTVLIGETISGQSHICPEMVSPIRVSLHQSNTAEVPILTEGISIHSGVQELMILVIMVQLHIQE